MPQTANPTKPLPEALTRYVALSYPLSSRTPYPGGGRPLRITPTSQLARGDISNTSLVEFWNHMGTHMDGPGHMTSAGPFTRFCPPTGLFLNSVIIVDFECPDSKLIGPKDVKWPRGLASCELLLLRTGFSLCRQSDPKRYTSKNPGISVDFARFVDENFPRACCLGIDAISFAAAEHLAEGIAAHKILFERSNPVLLIEDMNLAFDLTLLQRVLVVPFFIEDLDSCPCTVIAEVQQPAGSFILTP